MNKKEAPETVELLTELNAIRARNMELTDCAMEMERVARSAVAELEKERRKRKKERNGMDELVKMNKTEISVRMLTERLKGFTTPELCDGAGLYHSMDWQIRPWVGNNRICGPAVTVDVPSGEGGIVADAILSERGGCACGSRQGKRKLLLLG